MISFEPLRMLMRDRNITSYFLRNKCGRNNLDSKTIQRLMNDESVSTNTINALCSIFDCKFDDIMIFLPDPTDKSGDNSSVGGEKTDV